MTNIRDYLSQLGKKGAAATNSKLTAAQRKESARKAANARWAKADKLIAKMKDAEEALSRTKQKKKKSAPTA